jgi:hypothetical protein
MFTFFVIIRQIPDLPHATAGPSKKPKKNMSGVEGRIVDPVARSAAQRAAKEAGNAGRLASVALEEGGRSVADNELQENLDIEREESVPSPVRPQPARALARDVSVRYFIFF